MSQPNTVPNTVPNAVPNTISNNVPSTLPNTISGETLARISQQVSAQLGWHYPPERHPDLRRGLEHAARELGYTDLERGVRQLTEHPFSARQIEILATHLTIGETYFWREPQALEAFASQILPGLLTARAETFRSGASIRASPLQIWCAGCASGEEAYTLAMLLCEKIPPAQRAGISIFATDINPIFLRKAREGLYRNWSFRTLPDALKSRYFTQRAGGEWEVAPELRAMTHFSALNLMTETLPAPFHHASFDVIFCRNVLIYFDDQQITRTLSRFETALAPDGWLVVSSSETARTALSNFARVSFANATLFRKQPPKRSENPFASAALASSGRRVSPASESGVSQFGAASNSSQKVRESDLSSKRVPAAFATSKSAISTQSNSTNSQVKTVEIPVTGATVPAKIGATSIGATSIGATSIGAVRLAADAGDFDAALRGVENLIEADKLSPVLHFLRATILHGRGDNVRALRGLQRALFLDGDFALGHFSLANIARESGQFELARRHFEVARLLLGRLQSDEIVPESDGITAGQLSGAVDAALGGKK